MADFELKVVLLDRAGEQRDKQLSLLGEAGCQVRAVENISRAQRAIANDPPDVLLASAGLLAEDDWRFCSWLRGGEFTRHVYLIVSVEHDTGELAVAALEAGADQVVRAELPAEELAARLRVAQRTLEREASLRRQAKCDLLTGLASEAVFAELLEKEWSRSRRYGLPLSCVALELEGLEEVARQGGQAFCNESLRRIAQLLQRSCRTSDLVCRREDNRFLILLPETNEKNAALWANRICARIPQLPLDDEREPLTVRGRGGVAQRLEDTQSGAELIDLADQALAAARQNGASRVVTAHSLAEHRNSLALATSPHLFGNAVAEERMVPLSAVLRPQTTAAEATRTLLASGLTSLPVVDDQETLVGIVSERDLLVLQLWPDWREMTIGNVMQRNVVTYDAATPLGVIYEFLCRVTLRSVVITRNGRAIGLLGRRDLLLAQLDSPNDGPLRAASAAEAALDEAAGDEPLFPWFPPGCAPEFLANPAAL